MIDESASHGLSESNRGAVALAAAVPLLACSITALGMVLAARVNQRSSVIDQPGSVRLDEALGLALSVSGVLILGWWALGLISAIVTEVAGRTGHNRRAAAWRPLAPNFLRRAVIAVLSLQIVTAAPAMAQPAPTPVIATVAAPAATHLAQNSSDGTTSPEEPDPLFVPRAPAVDDQSLLVRGQMRAEDSDESVTVHEGDSLWSIAAAHIGPLASPAEVAEQWPHWYSANRDAIGPDPNVLLIGAQLTIPPTLSTSTTTAPSDRSSQ